MEHKLMTWSKAMPFSEKQNLISHARLHFPKFRASYQKIPTPVNMWDLISYGYRKLWYTERNAFMRTQKNRLEMQKKLFLKRNPTLSSKNKM